MPVARWAARRWDEHCSGQVLCRVRLKEVLMGGASTGRNAEEWRGHRAGAGPGASPYLPPADSIWGCH